MRTNLWVNDEEFLYLAQESNSYAINTHPGGLHEQIPKIAHFIWLGRHPLPRFAKQCIERFQLLHSVWKVKCWFDHDVAMLSAFSNLDIFNQASNVGM
jgi:hypothetical protein